MAPACTGRRGAIDTALAAYFCGFRFHGIRPIRENLEILHHVKISHYTVLHNLTGTHHWAAQNDVYMMKDSAVQESLDEKFFHVQEFLQYRSLLFLWLLKSVRPSGFRPVQVIDREL